MTGVRAKARVDVRAKAGVEAPGLASDALEAALRLL